MVPQGDYVYMFGTPNRRIGTIGLARVPVDQVLNTTSYQYWSDGNWTPVSRLPRDPPSWWAGQRTVRPLRGGRGHLADGYLDPVQAADHPAASRRPRRVSGRTARRSSTRADYPGVRRLHPSVVDGEDLYFTISDWADYNVFLMKADIGG